MDNIKIKKTNDKVTIKKGWIRKNYVFLYFMSIFILYIIILILLRDNSLKETKLVLITSIIIKFNMIFVYWLFLNSKIISAVMYEEIEIDLSKSIFELRGHKNNISLCFNEIQSIEINKEMEEKEDRVYGIKIFDFNENIYMFGFALSKKKSQEIKTILLEIIAGDVK